jgi:hypothetical protein
MSDKTLRVERYEPGRREEWDKFVVSSKNGTMFHEQSFLAYHEPGKFTDHSLMFRDGGKLVAVMPAAEVEERGRRDLRSHPGASYGGLVLPHGSGVLDALALARALLDYAEEAGFEAVRMRLSESVFHVAPSEELDRALLTTGFGLYCSELSTAVSLPVWWPEVVPDEMLEEEVMRRFQPSARQNVRKARRVGLSVQDADTARLPGLVFGSYWEMLKENLRKHDATPTHTLDDILRLRELLPEMVKLFVARNQSGTLVGGMVVFLCNMSAAHTMYFASMKEAQHLRPLDLTVLHVLKYCAKRGRRHLNFGISTERQGTILNNGLFRFKENFGGGGTLRNTWEWRRGV